MKPSKLIFKLSSYIPAEKTDLVEGFLYENAPSSWALEVNHITGEGILLGFFSSEKETILQQSTILDEIGQLVELNFSIEHINDRDWKESYKDHFTPWSYRGFHLIPLWLKNSYTISREEISLFLDPGMAFGTGNHESTRMCLEFLIEKNEFQKRTESILDLGCGSGILSLAASLIGYKHVWGIDYDIDAIRISKENAVLNNLQDKISFDALNLFDLNGPCNTFDCVVANIQADVLISNAKKILQHTHTGSSIILSGILTKEIEQVIDEFTETTQKSSLNYNLKQLGEWSAVQFFIN